VHSNEFWMKGKLEQAKTKKICRNAATSGEDEMEKV
jgi:hypothetical protein